MRKSVGGLILAAVLAVGVTGGALAASWWATGEPEALGPVGEQTVVTTTTSLDDRRFVDLVVEAHEPMTLTSEISGRVTADRCEVGGLLASGDRLFSVDGKPVRLLATEVPLWRDLRVGTRGPDVAAVQQELARLGVDVPDSGVVDVATAAAVRDWITTGSDRILADMVALDRQLVLPTERVVWSAVRVAVVGQCATDLVAAFLAYPDGETRLDGELVLTEPVAALSVPPAAVIGAGTGATCLLDPEGETIGVVVISSQLGQALVTPVTAGQSLPQRVVLDTTGERSCR